MGILMTSITERINELNKNYNVFAYHDIDLSRLYYDDWKQNLYGKSFFGESRRGDISYIVIGDMSKPFFTKTSLLKMKKKELLDLCEFYDLDYSDCSLNKKEIVDILLGVDCEEHYRQYFKETNYSDLDYTFKVVGYSQGDLIKVLILDSEYSWNTKEYLTNLFYSCPIYGVFTWQGQEYHIYEYLNDEYNWDKKEFIENFKKVEGCIKGLDDAVEFLQQNLPEQLDYK